MNFLSERIPHAEHRAFRAFGRALRISKIELEANRASCESAR